ncbi:MAG: DHA2 family efflux MFS transporter permease subunit [Lactobacillaceae bacterium]|jgi:EmrB/QacA subfamily drug resistance transporter|nr:DHA2 family efflux MFS transporter permease subunit [Lactobacillaceae bacterium]
MEEFKKPKHLGLITTAILIATFMSAVESTVVSTAMPTIVGDLQGIKLMSWVFTIYMLTQTIATPIFGKLSDVIGRKPTMIAGLLIFLVGSTMSGLSSSMELLIFWRGIQGIGAGGIMPVAFTIIADIYPPERRAAVLGLNSTAWGFASLVGPMIGGYLVQVLSWHWVFFINIPFGIAVIFILLFFFKDSIENQDFKLDVLGIIWMSLLIVAILMTFEFLGQSELIFSGISLVIAIIGLILFIHQENKSVDPLIDLKMFNSSDFTRANLIAGLVAGYIIAYNVYMPTWMQALNGVEPALAGFVVTPSSVVWMLGAYYSGKIIAKYNFKILFNGGLIVGLGYAIFLAVVPGQSPFPLFLISGLIFGLSMGAVVTTTTVVVQQAVPKNQVGMATSFNNLVRALAQTIMTSVYGVLLNISMMGQIAKNKGLKFNELNKLVDPKTAKSLPMSHIQPLRDIMAFGLHNIFWVAAILVLVAIIINNLPNKNLKQN